MLKHRHTDSRRAKNYYRCSDCSQTINKKLHKHQHVCGEKYCTFCKAYVDAEHMCYMQPVKQEQRVQEELEYRKRKRDVKPYIFFDLECTQDDLIQCDGGHQPQTSIKCGNCYRKNCHTAPCEQGFVPRKFTYCKNCKQTSCGTFKHVPNLCVAHKVCRKCMHLPLNKESQCTNCGKNEHIFAGRAYH